MSRKIGIQRFLDDVDPKILARGEDYYRSGQVENVEWDGGHVTAEVSGREEDPYLVELDFSEDGEVEDWSCDCPYDRGPVCKHTAAVLLALQAGAGKKKRPKVKKPQKVSIQELVERADKEQLTSLILEYCREDKRFRSLVLSELEDSGEQEFAAIKELVRASIRSNTHQHYIDERGCDHSCMKPTPAVLRCWRNWSEWNAAYDPVESQENLREAPSTAIIQPHLNSLTFNLNFEAQQTCFVDTNRSAVL